MGVHCTRAEEQDPLVTNAEQTFTGSTDFDLCEFVRYLCTPFLSIAWSYGLCRLSCAATALQGWGVHRVSNDLKRTNTFSVACRSHAKVATRPMRDGHARAAALRQLVQVS